MNVCKLRRAGFTLLEILIVAAIISLLAAIAIPNYIASRSAAQKNTCINNLRQIESAIQQWATEHKKPESAMVDGNDILPYLRGPAICPAGGIGFEDSYLITTVAAAPACQKVPLTHVWLGSGVEVASRPP